MKIYEFITFIIITLTSCAQFILVIFWANEIPKIIDKIKKDKEVK